MKICDRCFPFKTELAQVEIVFGQIEHYHLCSACAAVVKATIAGIPPIVEPANLPKRTGQSK
jgi:hypothetical protein